MKILVTGGSGFIGSYFYDLLLEDGHELVILDLIEPGFDAPRATYLKGDIRDHAAVRGAMQGCDYLLHLAAAHHDFGIERPTYFDVNEQGMAVLAEVMDELGVRKCCFYSSVAVYGDAHEPHHEDSGKQPNNHYGESKLAGEVVLKQWAEKGEGRSAIVIRPTVTFGPRNFANMYSLIRQIDSGKFVQVGKADNIKSLSYVENIIRATTFLMARQHELPPFDIYNYIDKPDLTSSRITEVVYEALGKKKPGFAVPMWLAQLLALPFDIVIKLTGKNLPVSSMRIKKLFAARTKFESDKILAAGFEPPVPLEEGIRRMVKWYQAGGKDQEAVWHLPPAEVVRAENKPIAQTASNPAHA
ncbi:MAG: NAD(P)-dependent oxidoreductase [Planctomycetota bacterium]